MSQKEKGETNKRRRPRGFVRIQILYLSDGQVRGLSDFRAVAGSGSRRLSTQGHELTTTSMCDRDEKTS